MGMQIEAGSLVLIGLPCVTGLVWLIRLEGRVNLTESRFLDLKSDIHELRRDIKELIGQ